MPPTPVREETAEQTSTAGPTSTRVSPVFLFDPSDPDDDEAGTARGPASTGS